MSQLWERLRQARRYADMTQNDLSKLCGVSRGAVALWEAADPEHRTKPTTDHLIAIAKATGVPLEWLLNDSSDINEIWRLGGEFGGRPSDRPEGSRDGEQEPDPLPDLRQGEHVFTFANTPEQLARKLKQLTNEPPDIHKHVIYIGPRQVVVQFVATPADALSAVVEILTKT